jgi:membrane protein
LHIPWRGWLDILVRVALRIFPDQFGLIAAGVAFYTLSAIFPAIAAMIALGGLFTDPVKVVVQLEGITRLVPTEAASILLDQAEALAGSPSEGLTIAIVVGIGFALYLITRSVTSLIHGLNIAYEEVEKRSFLRFWGTVIALTIFTLFGAVIILMLLVVLPTILAFIPIELATERILTASRWALLAIVFIGAQSVLYRWGPSRRNAKWRWLTPGAGVAGILWFLGSMGFAAYVSNFANYNQTFGSLGGVIILMTWLWLTAFIVLLGALLDAEIEAQTARDSTVGPDRPMGKRGAVKADKLGKPMT